MIACGTPTTRPRPWTWAALPGVVDAPLIGGRFPLPMAMAPGVLTGACQPAASPRCTTLSWPSATTPPDPRPGAGTRPISPRPSTSLPGCIASGCSEPRSQHPTTPASQVSRAATPPGQGAGRPQRGSGHLLQGRAAQAPGRRGVPGQPPGGHGVFLVLGAKAPAPVRKVTGSPAGSSPPWRRRSSTPVTTPFHIMDPDWGHVTIKMSGHPPVGTQIMLNGRIRGPGLLCPARPPGRGRER